MMEMYDKVKRILSDPASFFASIKEDKDYMAPWSYYMIMIGLTSLIGFVVSIPAYFMPWFDKGDAQFGIPVLIIILFFMYLFSVVLGMGLIFVSAGVIHLFLLMVGATKGYLQTFKTICYSSTPMLIAAPFGILTAFWIPGTIIYYVVMMGFSIYVLYIEVTAVKILHEISTTRAIVALFVIPLAIALILFALLFVFIIGLIAILASQSGGITGMVAKSVM